MPEGCDHHVLNAPSFAVSEFYFDSFLRHVVRPWRVSLVWTLASAGLSAIATCGVVDRLAIPFRIAEMVMRLHEVVYRKVILTIE